MKLTAWKPWLCSIITPCVPLFLYWATLAPDIFAADSVELTTGAYSLGIIHPPGYPIYLVLGHLLIHLPIGPNPGYRMNLMSAVFASLTAWIAFHIILKFVTSKWQAMFSALLGALSFYIWGESNVAEVYSLHWLLILLSLLFLTNWIKGEWRGWLYLFALASGLSLAHHITSILIFPGYIALLFFNSHKRPRIRQLVVSAALVLIGLMPYAYLPLRYLSKPGLDYARKYLQVNLTRVDELIWFISGGPFRSLVQGATLEKWLSEAWLFLRQILYNYLGVGCLLSLAGIAGLSKRDKPFLIATLISFTVTALFYINYNAFDKYTMYGICLWIMAIWIGIGLEQMSKWAFSTQRTIVFAALLTIMQVIVFYPQSDMSQTYQVRQEGIDILSELPANTIYLGTWSEVMVIEYLQVVEKQRLDVLALNMSFVSPIRMANYSQELQDTSRPLCFSAHMAREAEREEGVIANVQTEHCYQLEQLTNGNTPWIPSAE
jgi:hypothetical protein